MLKMSFKGKGEFPEQEDPEVLRWDNALIGHENTELRARLEKIRDLQSQIKEKGGPLKLAMGILKRSSRMREQLPRQPEGKPYQVSPFEEWQKGISLPYENRISLLEEQATAGVRAIATAAISLVMKADRGAKRVPFIFYNFGSSGSGGIIGTPAAWEVLGVDEARVKGNFNLHDLLGFVCAKDRKELYDSMRKGDALTHREIWTSGKNSRVLYLTSYPTTYRIGGETYPVGVAVLLNDPAIAPTKSRNHTRFRAKVGAIVNGLGEELSRTASI